MRLLLPVLLLSAVAATPTIAAERDLYFGVTLVDPERETVTPKSYILVEDGRIVATGRGKPAAKGARRHDFTGLYALPGLIDTHAHVTLGPVDISVDKGVPKLRTLPSDDITAHNARMLLSFGVTTIRNPGGGTRENVAYARDVKAGRLAGPEMIYAAEIIDRGPFGFENLVTLVSPDRGPAAIVAEQAKAGASYVKLYSGLTEADIADAVKAADAHGLRTVAHLSSVSWQRAAELGVNSFVHMMPVSADLLPAATREAWRKDHRPGTYEFFEWYEAADLDGPEVRRLIATLAARKVHVDATLVAFQPAFWGDDPTLFERDIRYDHPAMVASWRRFRFDMGWKPADYARAKAVWPRVLDLTRRMYEAGVPMSIGTDQANPWIAPGLSVSREMALHQQAGIPAWAVLRMATSDAARLIGVGDRTGALRPGLEADILFIAADPRPDLDRVADVRAVVNNGTRLAPERLRAGK
ncbi:amidohydrolase family protein [Sphingoaurantiacus capsulatus]|uniref:Amidohydrolase family protein n=1 Tax=Sphingoaurantiacus capsulatus TaxID=1771310 RepID=A0ABV7X9C9_9SPHN